MALILASSWETNSITAGMEFGAVTGTISTGNVHTGTYSGRVSSLVSGTNQRFRTQFISSANNGPFFFRFYEYFVTLPSAENRFVALSNSTTTGTGVAIYLTVDASGVIRLYDEDGQIGSGSGAISTGQYYAIEIQYDRTRASGSHYVRARLDHVEFAGAINRALSVNINQIYIGGNLNSEAQTQGEWYSDDLVIYNTSGSYNVSWPGAGAVAVLRPSGVGDNTNWTRGGADSGSNWGQVSENPPNDATSYVTSNVAGQIDNYTLEDTPAGITSGSIIRSVSVSVRFAGAAASSNASFQVGLRFSGTSVTSSTITPNGTTYRTNDISGNTLVPVLVSTTAPGTSRAWTKADLDSAQVELSLATASTNSVRVSGMWVTIEYSSPASRGGFMVVL